MRAQAKKCGDQKGKHRQMQDVHSAIGSMCTLLLLNMFYPLLTLGPCLDDCNIVTSVATVKVDVFQDAGLERYLLFLSHPILLRWRHSSSSEKWQQS